MSSLSRLRTIAKTLPTRFRTSRSRTPELRMDSTLILVGTIILVALVFDFVNGFHDAANSIATVVATKVLTPAQAVLWAAGFNFIAAFSVGTGVAKTVGAGMIDLQYVTQIGRASCRERV